MFFDSAQCQDEAQTETWEVPSEHQNAFLCCEGGRTQSAQKGSVASLVSIFKNHLDMRLGSLIWVFLLEEELDQVDPEVSANLSHCVCVCVYRFFIFQLSTGLLHFHVNYALISLSV